MKKFLSLLLGSSDAVHPSGGLRQQERRFQRRL